MPLPTRWTWVWVNSKSWWWTGRPGVLQFMGSHKVGHDWATELNWTERYHDLIQFFNKYHFPKEKHRVENKSTFVTGKSHSSASVAIRERRKKVTMWATDICFNVNIYCMNHSLWNIKSTYIVFYVCKVKWMCLIWQWKCNGYESSHFRKYHNILTHEEAPCGSTSMFILNPESSELRALVYETCSPSL